jgi:hypothetical protein
MRQTIITPNEVKKYSPSDIHDDTALAINFIINKEEKLFNNHFGWDFYQALLADIINYETLPAYKGDYSQAASYTTGDVVQFVDELYVTNQNVVGVSPQNKTIWSKAPKFANPDFEYIWQRYLCIILAFNVLYTSVLYKAIQASARGLLKQKDDSFDAASLKEIDTYKKGLYDDALDAWQNMHLYIERNPSKYHLYKPLQDKNCTEKRVPRSNYGFNVFGSKYAKNPNLKDLNDD